MSKQRLWTPFLCALALLGELTSVSSATERTLDFQVELPASPTQGARFVPPTEDSIPENDFGDMIRLGKNVFINTQKYAAQHVGNGLNCANCHLNNGRNAASAPLWAAIGMYPAYRKKNDRVNTFQDRIQGCFRYSLNGRPPETNSKIMTALVTYAYWMSKGTPVGVALPGRGYPKLEKTSLEPNYARGEALFAKNCVLCHGADGQGTKVAGSYVFPPLWGDDSYNWGAGMHRINTAAGFIKANMPYGKGGTLTDQEAWDLALFINSQERPADPRYAGDFAYLDRTFHKHQCRHGDESKGQKLGQHNLGKLKVSMFE